MDQSLIKWINTFSLSESCGSLIDLSDAVLLYEICNQISSKYFDSQLTAKQDLNNNWVLKSENVKKLLDGIESYFSTELFVPNIADGIDADKIAKDDISEIQKVVKIVLGMVVECEDKLKYIMVIQNDLDSEVQNDLMQMISEVHNQMGTADHSRTSFDGVDPGTHSDTESKSGKDNVLSDERISIFNHRIEQLEKEKSQLQIEVEELTLATSQTERANKTLSDEKENLVELCTNLQQSLQESQKIIDEHKQHAASNVMSDHRIKEEIHTLQLQIEEKDKFIHQLNRKLDEGTKLTNENRELKDEIDILRERAATAEATEEKLKRYQQKIEEISELKKQMRTMEDNNDNYLQQILDLEEQLKKSVSYKSQMEASKQQLLSLKIENTKMELSLKSVTDERDKLQSTVSQLELDHQSLSSQLTHQRSKVEQLEQDNDSKILEQSSFSTGGGGLDQMMDSSTKERLFRLERENKRLQEAADRVTELENQLEESNILKDELMKQVTQLSTSSPSTTATATVVAPNPDNERQIVEIARLKQQLESVTAQLTTKTQVVEDNSKQMEELKKQLVEVYANANDASNNVTSQESKEKISTLESEKERLEGYLRAARKMIKDLREKNKENQSKDILMTEKDDFISKLEATIKQKDDKVDQLVRQLKEGKESAQRELNLMLTAFLNIGLEFESMKTRSNESLKQEPRAFLNKKRGE